MAFYIAAFVFAYFSLALLLIICKAVCRLKENQRLREEGLPYNVINWDFVTGVMAVWVISGLTTLFTA